MKGHTYIPKSPEEAHKLLVSALARKPGEMSRAELIKAWCAVAYLHPEIHSDDFEGSNTNWPEAVKAMAREVWRRYDKHEIKEDDVYPSDAAWAGVYDLMSSPTPEETKRRMN